MHLSNERVLLYVWGGSVHVLGARLEQGDVSCYMHYCENLYDRRSALLGNVQVCYLLKRYLLPVASQLCNVNEMFP